MNPINKLRPLVQLIPAVAVAAAVAVTLPKTAPVLAAVPERLTPPAEQTAESEAPEAEPVAEILPLLPYADGVYTGSSRGYGGKVSVQVTMEGGRITDLEILNASHETSAFLKRAKRLLPTVLEAQTWEVDAVSEATYTSRGILGAIQNALTGEVVNNPLPPQPEVPTEPPVVEEFVAPSTYRDGVYTGTARGFGGDITVQVTLSNDTITDISIISADGETHSYFTRARYVISAMLTANSPEVDSISGATYSSTGIINAVKAALSSAAVSEEATSEEATEPLPEETGTALPEGSEEPAEEAPASESEEVMAPTVETVQPEEKPAVPQWVKDLWDAFFYPEPPDSETPASEAPAESEVPESQDEEPGQPAETPAEPPKEDVE